MPSLTLVVVVVVALSPLALVARLLLARRRADKYLPRFTFLDARSPESEAEFGLLLSTLIGRQMTCTSDGFELQLQWKHLDRGEPVTGDRFAWPLGDDDQRIVWFQAEVKREGEQTRIYEVAFRPGLTGGLPAEAVAVRAAAARERHLNGALTVLVGWIVAILILGSALLLTGFLGSDFVGLSSPARLLIAGAATTVSYLLFANRATIYLVSKLKASVESRWPEHSL